MPAEIKRREDRLAAIATAKAKIEARAKERFEREQAEYEAKMAKRKAKQASTGKKPGGKPPKPPQTGPQAEDQINLTDEDSRIMKVAGGGFEQCYNAQAVVDTESMLVVAPHITTAGNDKEQVAPMLECIQALPDGLNQPARLLADTGFYSERNVQHCHDAGVEPLIAVGRDAHHPDWRSRFEFATSPVDAQSQWGSINARIVIEAPVDGKVAITYEHGGGQVGKLHASPRARVVLFKDLTSASLQYLYRSDLGVRGEPSTPGQPPELVTLIWAGDENPKLIQSISIRPRLNAGANCQLEVQSARCR